MRHHITVLQGLCREGDLEEARTYLETLSRRPELSRSSGCTVHPAVDAVLTAMLARSTKSGVHHGMGLKSARATARKYHSELVLKADQNTFSASTALLLPETKA